MASIVKSSIEYFADPTKGRPVANGYVYVGTVDLDPEVPANQKQISVIQENGTTVQVSQPLSLSAGGVPVYSGGYVTIVVDGDYSLKVNDKHGAQVYYIPKSSALVGEKVIATIGTIQELRDSDLHILVDAVSVLGYTTKGDEGGGPIRYWKTGTYAPADDNGGSIIVATGITTGAWLWEYSGETNVKWFGTTGDGSTDDTTAIENCWAYCSFLISSGQSSVGWDKVTRSQMFFPTGTYLYNGTGLTASGTTNPSVKIQGEGTSHVTVKLGASSFFINLTESVATFTLHGFTFIGGKGVFYDGSTASLVSGGPQFIDCSFFDYTQCAIGFADPDIDRPNILVSRCSFSGSPTVSNIGVVLPGGGGHVIDDCWFNKGLIYIKTGSYEFGSEVTMSNIRFGKASAQTGNNVKIWLKTGAFPFSGQGTRINNCNFGSENLAVGDTNILIADGDGTSDMTLEFPALTVSTSPVTSIYIDDCICSGNDTEAPSIITTYTSSFNENIIKGVSFTGTSPDSVITDNSTSISNNQLSKVNKINITSQNSISRKQIDTGLPVVITDDLGVQQRAEVTITPGGYDSGHSEMLLLRDLFTNLQLGGSASKVIAADSLGGQTAATCTVPSTNVRLPINSTEIIRAGEVVWIEFDGKQAAANTATYIELAYQESGTDIQQIRTFKLTPDWTRYRFPVIQEKTGSTLALAWSTIDSEVTPGSNDQFIIGIPAAYRSRSPVPYYGHIRSIDSGWDTTHLILGSYHLWIDATGDLRIKSSAPTSDTDGAVVGTQS